jgi:hypothetical protein
MLNHTSPQRRSNASRRAAEMQPGADLIRSFVGRVAFFMAGAYTAANFRAAWRRATETVT